MATAAENATSHVDSTVLPGTTYFYRVFSVSEGALSTALSGSQATSPAGNDICAGTGGLWNTPATWADGGVPTAADNVTIPLGCTVTIDSSNALTVTISSGGVLQFEDTTARTLAVTDDVTIDTGGTFRSGLGGIQTGHVLSVGGDLTNNGTIDFSTNGNTAAAGITFTGAANASFSLGGSSTTDLKQTGGVILNKGTNNTSVLSFSPGGTLTVLGANTAGFLTITNGTFKMDGSGAFSNPLFSVAAYAIPGTGALWMNNANATVIGQNGSPTLSGRFQMTSGIFNIGTSTGNSMGFAAGANILVEGGAINATGRFGVAASTSAITYNQTGGTITTCTIGNASTTLACFDLGTGVGTTNITGGDIVIQNASTAASGPRDYRNQSGLTGTTTVTGGTVQFGNANTAAVVQAFDVAGVFPNVVVTNATAAHTVTMLAPAVFNNVSRDVLINPGTTFNVGNNVFLFNGTTITNNGILTGNGASTNFVIFRTAATVTYTGSGTVTSPLTNLAVQADGGNFTIDAATSGINVNAVRLFSGNIINANELTIGSGGATASTVQVGNTTTPTNAGTFDSMPTFNPGTGGIIFSYLRTGASRTMGPEIPASHSINNLTYDDNDITHSLTVGGGDLTVLGTMALTNGVINTGANTITHNGATVTRTTGYINGTLNRSFTATGAYPYHVGQNGYSPVPATITTLTTNPSSLSVRATDSTLPGLNAGTSVSRYWTLGETGDLTADLGFTYIDADLNGTETDYRLYKVAAGVLTNMCPGGPCVNDVTNTASITGVTDFSDWGIGENGSGTPGTLAFSSATYSGGENSGFVTVTVNRTGGSANTVTIDYASVAGGTATGGASCTAGIDYVNASGTLTFLNGETSKTFDVTLCDETTFEPDETVNLSLTNATGGATIGSPNAAVLTITNDDPVPPTNVVVNPGAGAYATLGDAIAAINAGTHTGAITVDIMANTTETGAMFLNSSGAGSASYTSIVIRPGADAVTVAGPTVTGRGLIELNGADNVTIDGDNPLTGGTNRNLTIQNTAVNTVTFTSAIRIALNTTTVNSADNNIIRNLNIAGSATARNISTTVTTDSQNNTYGILATASASGATTAPTAISSLTTVIATGATAANLQVSNNTVTTAGRAISIQGSATTVFSGLSIQNNSIGNPTVGAPDQIYVRGISAQGSANGVISGNTVYVEGFVGSSGSSATVGIDVGSISTQSTFTIEKNKVNRVRNNNTQTWATYGINLGGGNTHVVRNNFVTDILNNQVAGTGAFNTTFGAIGIRVGLGTGHQVYHNSVNLFGALPGIVSTDLTAALGIAGTGQTGVNVRNNVFVNTVTGGNPTGTRNVAIFLPSGATSAMNLTLNNNDYFVGSDAQNRMAQVGTTFGTGEFTLADFDPSSTTPAANFRSYSSTLSAAGTNDDSSKKVDPLFVSNADLHLQAASTMQASGAATGVTDDIDGDTRQSPPDLGADEIVAVAVPGTLAFSSATYAVGEAGPTVTLTVNRTGGSDGAVSADYALAGGTATGGAACGGSTDYVNTGGTVNFANGETSKTFDVAICSDVVFEGNETFDATLSNPTGGATIGTPNPATVTITDDELQPTVQFSSPTYTTVDELAEGVSGGAVIEVTLSGPSQGTATVNFATVPGGTATGGTSCTPGVDYVNAAGVLTFVPGDVSESFFIATCLDSVDEPDETINLALATPTGTTLGTPNAAVLTMIDNDAPVGGPVTVTATAGTPGPTNYPTLKDAIDAINLGTHQGDITVSIVTSTTETATSVLNAGTGAAPAAYTSVLIRPVSDAVSIAGPSVQGRGLIELNGADNVTIDGDNPNSAGTNRDLTIQNTAANTVTFTSVIRIALNTTTVTSGDNNIFRNLNVLGSATGRNIPTGNTTTGTENNSFAILLGLGASAPTTAPAAIASVSTGIASPGTAANLQITNNNVRTAARAISINATATTVAPGLVISNNSIGNPTAGDPDQVTAIGITAQGSTNAMISGNTVWVEGLVPSSAAGHGINVGVNSVNVTGATIQNNRVNRVRNNNTTTWSAFGINLGGGSNHIVQNNFVSGVINNQVAGTGAFGTTFGAYGIRVASGTGHDIYHNSVHLYDPLPGVVSTNLTAAFMIVATGQTGVDVRNNIFSNQIAGGNPATPGTRNVAVFLPSGATVAMNLTWNNNAYYVGTDALNRLAQVGTAFGSGEFQAADFDASSTTPATNFRAYTSTLSAAGTNDNASFASATVPPFTSNVDLHIPAGTATRLESGGAAVGVTTDIDAETRNATTPDIGADEFAGAPPPPNDMAASAFIVPVNGSTISTGALTPQARFTNNGTAPQTNVTVRFRIVDSSMVEIYNQTATIASIAPFASVVVSFPSTSIMTAGAYTMHASAELVGDTNTSNDVISGSFNAVVPIGGTVSVGTGETFTSLTNPGGLFQALNTAGICSNVTVNITSDLTAETGAVALNQLAESAPGGYTVTFKPSGAARTISGTAAVNIGLIKLNGADRIVFDGSLSGGTDRSLTITNNQTGLSTVVWIAAGGASNGATNNTIKNCIINGAVGATATTTIGVLGGSGTTLGNPAEAPNNNNTIQNNEIYRVQNSFYNQGNVGLDQNWALVGNSFGRSAAGERNSFRGMLIGNTQNFVINNNTIQGVTVASATAGIHASGIQLAFSVNGGMISNNRISDLRQTGTQGTYGMQIGGTAVLTNVTIANNFIWDLASVGSATVINNGHGIMFNGATAATNFKLYHNSINMSATQTSGTTSALHVSGPTAAGTLDVRNNIFANTAGAGATRFAVHSTSAAAVYNPINNNDYFADQVGFIGGTARPTLADWQTGTGQDANSLAVDPLFVSATDLHLQATSTLLGMGAVGTGILTDIDGQTRDTPPDIGADEIIAAATPGSVQFSSATYSVGEGGGTVTLTVTRTGGTSGAISVNYATAAGTATGGASCVAGIDYVNTNGTLNWPDGDGASKTFDVTICSDGAFEPDETFTGTLSGATGGATIGTPNPATVTITNDDPPPSGLFSISDVRLFEGNSGAVNASFTVTFVGGSPASVQYSTANGTATSGTDFLPASGTLNFNTAVGPEGIPTSSQTVTVVVNSDVAKEANETFFVNLTSPINGTIVDPQGVGIIVDEDRAYVADFDRDLRADVSVYRPGEGVWYVLQSASLTPKLVTFGLSTDTAVPADYDGDGEADYALWRPSTGEWFRFLSATATKVINTWGSTGDIPVQGDYDGDGKADLAIYRPSTGQWWISNSSDGSTSVVSFGISTDKPVQGDYDGDARTDRAVYRDGTWYILRSSDGGVAIANWGLAADRPVSGDFDGDGSNDLAIYRNDGSWWIRNSLTGTVRINNLGLGTDIPVPADYDGDGTTDLGVFRPSNGDWYILRSSGGGVFGPHWGQAGDVPVPTVYIPQ